jgi:hypothetical protein
MQIPSFCTWRRTNTNHKINFITQLLDQMLNPIAVLDQTNPMSFTVENGTAYLKMD